MFAVIRGTPVAVFFRQKLGGAVPPSHKFHFSDYRNRDDQNDNKQLNISKRTFLGNPAKLTRGISRNEVTHMPLCGYSLPAFKKVWR